MQLDVKKVWKMIDCESLESFQGNIFDRPYFSKESYKPAVYYSTIKRVHHRLFLQYVHTTSCVKKYFEKKIYGEPTF